MAIVPLRPEPSAKTNVDLLLEGRPPFGLPPRQDWHEHNLALPDELWCQLGVAAERLAVSRSALAAYALHGLLLAQPRRVGRGTFPRGADGDRAYTAYNIAKGRLGRQIVANAHIFPEAWRVVPGRAPLEHNPRVGAAPANLPPESGGVEFFAVLPPAAGQAPLVKAVVLAVRTTAVAHPGCDWHLPEAGITTARAAERAGLPVLLIRILLAEDPPIDIVDPAGMLRAVRSALCIPAQYRLDWWELGDPTVSLAPEDGPAGPRRFVVRAGGDGDGA